MNRQTTVLLLVLLLLVVVSSSMLVAAPAGQTAPTLVPPTLVPTMPPSMIDALPNESGVARIVRDGTVRVGILYNEPPFGEFNVRGENTGFDADLARSIAEAWGVTVTFSQATRQTGIELVANGDIDLLIAAQPHLRELDNRVEFSQSYYPSTQVLIVRNGDGATALGHMADRKIGIVMGTRAEMAVADWDARTDYSFSVTRYMTLDRALAALLAGEVDGVVENRMRLERVILYQAENYRFVDEPVMSEPYAIALRRQDANLRNLVNRTLQYLYQSGRLNELHQTHFEGASYPTAGFVLWSNVGDEAPRPANVASDVPFPFQYVVPKLQTDRVVRVAGLRDLPADAPDSQRRLDAANRALINAMAMRWNVTVQPIPGDNPVELVASGQADIAIGVTPDWASADRVDFTSYYLRHGLRMMIRSGDSIGGLTDLRGQVVGVFQDEPGVRELITTLAENQRAIVNDFFTILREQDAAYAMLVDNNARVVIGDSLRLLPQVEANEGQVELLTDANGNAVWYSREYVGMAVPRNDIDFRLLVEYTLQELARDGTLLTALQPVMYAQDAPTFEYYPGPTEYLGFNLSGRQG
ncbi:MAG: transporter substrate-binding domain-containing protein [Anaerolinea sp.]|nr:transporter substrate-binding domain-containing protein [Anaerolinea sp.]